MMGKEDELRIWCNKQISHHNKIKGIVNLVRVDAAKQVKTMIDTKGWEGLKQYIKENMDKMLSSNMVGPHALGVFYRDVKNKIWSIEKKGDE